MVNPRKVGERLRKLRGDNPPEYIAWKARITKEAYMMYERGDRIPRDPTKVALAELFGVSVQELFFDEDVNTLHD